MKRAIFVIMIGLSFAAFAEAQEGLPKELEGVGITPRLGEKISLDTVFTSESGDALALSAFFKQGRPVLLNLVYYSCPNLCTYLLSGMVEALKKLSWTPGRDFEIVTVSIDPNEGYELAAQKKESYFEAYGRPEGREGWHFLVGQEAEIRKLADEIGFSYKYDEEIQQYAHAAGIFVMTSEGTLARTLLGMAFDPRDLRLALLEAGQGKIGNVVDQILLFCYRYDPKANKYALFATRLMKLAGLVTVLALVLLIMQLKKKKN